MSGEIERSLHERARSLERDCWEKDLSMVVSLVARLIRDLDAALNAAEAERDLMRAAYEAGDRDLGILMAERDREIAAKPLYDALVDAVRPYANYPDIGHALAALDASGEETK